jgi:hypothetical protein
MFGEMGLGLETLWSSEMRRDVKLQFDQVYISSYYAYILHPHLSCKPLHYNEKERQINIKIKSLIASKFISFKKTSNSERPTPFTRWNNAPNARDGTGDFTQKNKIENEIFCRLLLKNEPK